MARSLRVLLLFAVALVSVVTLPPAVTSARAAELDKKGKSDAKEAMRLYKEGNYEDAAKVFARLSINYPDMLVFVRNLGACYYYLRRWEPAISNLRDYEHRKKDIAADDRAEIAGWIGEMERLRDQAVAPPSAPAPTSQPATAPAASAPSAPLVASRVAMPAPSPTAGPLAASAVSAAASSTSTDTTNAASTDPAAAKEPTPPDQPPAYPPAQWGSQSTYPPGPYGTQPAYPQTPYQYGAPSTYPYPGIAPAPAAGQVAAAPAGRSAGRRVATWILGIGGLTAISVGALCTFKALDDFSKVQKKYDPALEDEGKKFAAAQWVGYGVGGALLVTAIIVGASGGGSSPGVALAPAIGPGSAGATLAGTF